jgi:hypothetical protein
VTDDRGAAALERLVFFSDAVFAIAITLLVIEIDVPAGEGDLLAALRELAPQLTSFLVSFAVIGTFWMGHHRMFRHIDAESPRLVQLNLLLLFCVAFLPFPTAMLGEHDGDRVAAVVYAISMAATGLASAGLWRHASRSGGGRLLEPGLPAATVQYLARRSLVVPGVFLLSLPFALLGARAAEAVWLIALPAPAILRRVHRQEG